MYCYRHTPKDQWLLRRKLDPDAAVCSAYIAAREGPLPVGARTWRVTEGSGFYGRTITVTLQ